MAMQHSRLANRTILSTRPGGLSADLQKRLHTAGAHALHLPTMEIFPVEDTKAAKRLLGTLVEFDIVIFISRNAVKYACELASHIVDRLSGKIVLAVGSGTFDELKAAGFGKLGYTDSNKGSEALLDNDELQQENVLNKRIMIARGQGGRELLGDELKARGAEIQYVELYRRVRPQHDSDIVRNLWRVEKPDAVIVTSAEGLGNLLEMTGEEEQKFFLNTRLVVISQRLKDIAKSMGFMAEISISTGFSNEDLMMALRRLFEADNNE